MSDAHSEQRGHGVIQYRTVGAIEFGDGGQNESEWDVLQEIQVATTLEEKRVGVLRVAGAVLLRIEFVSDPLLVLDALVDDAVAEEQEVGCEG